MSQTYSQQWPGTMTCLSPQQIDTQSLASDVYSRVCRTDFTMPGFCAINVGQSIGSVAFRKLMVDLKQQMAAIHERLTGNTDLSVCRSIRSADIDKAAFGRRPR